jgi:hypothetical protein
MTQPLIDDPEERKLWIEVRSGLLQAARAIGRALGLDDQPPPRRTLRRPPHPPPTSRSDDEGA